MPSEFSGILDESFLISRGKRKPSATDTVASLGFATSVILLVDCSRDDVDAHSDGLITVLLRNRRYPTVSASSRLRRRICLCPSFHLSRHNTFATHDSMWKHSFFGLQIPQRVLYRCPSFPDVNTEVLSMSSLAPLTACRRSRTI